jgi:hypothetical protein
MSDSATACLDDAAALHVLSSRFCGPGAGADPGVSAVPADLLDHLTQIPDWRVQKWVEHPLAAVLALCAGAVVAGMRGFTAIAGWVRDVPADVLRAAYARCGHSDAASGPSKGTLWRVLTGTPGGALDAAIGAWLLRGAALRSESDPDTGPDLNAPGDLVAGRARWKDGPRRGRRRRCPGAPVGRDDPPSGPGRGSDRCRGEDERDPDVH